LPDIVLDLVIGRSYITWLSHVGTASVMEPLRELTPLAESMMPETVFVAFLKNLPIRLPLFYDSPESLWSGFKIYGTVLFSGAGPKAENRFCYSFAWTGVGSLSLDSMLLASWFYNLLDRLLPKDSTSAVLSDWTRGRPISALLVGEVRMTPERAEIPGILKMVLSRRRPASLTWLCSLWSCKICCLISL